MRGLASIVGWIFTRLYLIASFPVGSTVSIGPGARSTMKQNQLTPISDFPVCADAFTVTRREGWSGCRQSIGSLK
jgi:hypothetical protein